MKRTERIAIALTKEEKARIRVESSDLHISMSALIRMKVFAKPAVQTVQRTAHARPWEFIEETFTVTTKYKRTLPLIPGTPQHKAFEHHQNSNALRSELKRRLEEIAEEEILREVEIK